MSGEKPRQPADPIYALLRDCRLLGASLHAAHVSGAYFPKDLAPLEIEMSVKLGTRMRYG
jgi:hypothetical protein